MCDICSICLDEINKVNYWKCEQCTCKLHNDCYDRWNNGCPLCRINNNLLKLNLRNLINQHFFMESILVTYTCNINPWDF